MVVTVSLFFVRAPDHPDYPGLKGRKTVVVVVVIIIIWKGRLGPQISRIDFGTDLDTGS